MASKQSFIAVVALSLMLALSCVVFAGCSSASTKPANSTNSTAPKASASPSPQDAGATYETEDFKVTLPSAWGNDWKVNVIENRREAMNASNYIYQFEVNGQNRFNIECRKFELDGTARVGNSANYQVEFHPSNALSFEDETFIRSHIEVKGASGSGTTGNNAGAAGATSGATGEAEVSVPSNDYYKLTLPASMSDVEVTYEEGRMGGTTAVGATTTVMRNGSVLFQVSCFSNDWGPQGTQGNARIGTPSKASNCTVYVVVPAQQKQGGGYDTQAAQDQAKKYASYVTLL